MAKHPRCVEGYDGSLNQLAKSVGNMSYDKTAEFILELADKFLAQSEKDFKRGRTRLVSRLIETADALYRAHDEMSEAWRICKPYMKD
jgi:molybdenum-dependent DNA-binding transcriptional regulator ModE